MVIPYVAGMSEDIRRVCRKFNIRVVFKSGRTLHSMLTKVKDTLTIQCGISYPLQLRPSLHQRDQTEAGDETEGTPACLREGEDGEISCSGACVGEPPLDPLGGDHCMDHGRGQELLVKEALHILMTPAEECFN